MPRTAGGWVLAMLLAGCAADPAAGRIEVRWEGDSLSGRLATPALATWCEGRGQFLVSGIAGDSGFAVAVLPADSLADAPTPGRYPVADPGAPGEPRPSATLVLRRQEESRGIGFQSRSGTLELVRGDGDGWRGQFDGRIVSTGGDDTLSVRGEFRLPAAPATGPCDDPVQTGTPADTLP